MKNYIINYIDTISKDDILLFCKKNNISISLKELDILFYYIKNKYDIFFNNPNLILNEIKPLISENLFHIIKELYLKYKYLI